jgi:hypothetical protein
MGSLMTRNLFCFQHTNDFSLRRHKMIASENNLFRHILAVRFLNHGLTPVAIIMSPTSGLIVLTNILFSYMVFAHGLIGAPSRPCRFPGNKTRNEAVKKNSQPGLSISINSKNSTLQGPLLIANSITRQVLNFFSEETAVLSGKMRSLDFLPLFYQEKSGRKTKTSIKIETRNLKENFAFEI